MCEGKHDNIVCEAASVVSDSATPWTAAHRALLTMGFSRKERWSGLPFPTPMITLGK